LLLTASIILSGCANVRPAEKSDGDFAFALESGKFSDSGAISMIDSDYRFTVILANNLEWALESQGIMDYGLPHISQFKRGDKVTPFLTFGTFRSGDFDLTYSVRLTAPDGKSVEEHNNLLITRSTVNEGMTHTAQEFATISIGETYVLGTYQLYIVIKDGGNVRNGCVMQFEVVGE